MVKVVGAVHLGWLGAQALRSAWGGGAAGRTDAADPAAPSGPPSMTLSSPVCGFRQGPVTNLVNPKVQLVAFGRVSA